ncbi:hypothetical protein [Streptomyces sp. NPDC057676]|uniref:hypothetical protein n=1 Tax=Streptomyces sp. NPDC057676 TaxID=3346205 RepID=UPI0036CEACCA
MKHLRDKVVPRRRGVRVEALSAHTPPGRSEYRFIDGEGNKRTFTSALHTGRSEVTHDPRNPKRTAPSMSPPLPLAVPVTTLKLAVAPDLVAGGVVAAFSPGLP